VFGGSKCDDQETERCLCARGCNDAKRVARQHHKALRRGRRVKKRASGATQACADEHSSSNGCTELQVTWWCVLAHLDMRCADGVCHGSKVLVPHLGELCALLVFLSRLDVLRCHCAPRCRWLDLYETGGGCAARERRCGGVSAVAVTGVEWQGEEGPRPRNWQKATNAHMASACDTWPWL
jgi:hypothetical protein